MSVKRIVIVTAVAALMSQGDGHVAFRLLFVMLSLRDIFVFRHLPFARPKLCWGVRLVGSPEDMCFLSMFLTIQRPKAVFITDSGQSNKAFCAVDF
jgi:hypothetical protein